MVNPKGPQAIRAQKEATLQELVIREGKVKYCDAYGKLSIALGGGLSAKTFGEYVRSIEARGEVVKVFPADGGSMVLFSKARWDAEADKSQWGLSF